MVRKKVSYKINGSEFNYDVAGEFYWGEKIRQIDNDDNLLSCLSCNKRGYLVSPFLTTFEISQIRQKISGVIREVVEYETGEKLRYLEEYHKKIRKYQHRAVVKHLYGKLKFSELGISGDLFASRVGEILGFKVRVGNPNLGIDPDSFLIRVVRPDEHDNNPLHRDICLDRLRNAINMYLPLWGSNSESSLPIIPGSHLWYDDDIEFLKSGGKVNNEDFTVEAITDCNFPLEAIRPNPDNDGVMLFSPYTIHGGGRNNTKEETRFSLELRFWRH